MHNVWVTQNNRRVSGTITRQWGKESSKFTQWSYDETNDEILEKKGDVWSIWKRTGRDGRTRRNTRLYRTTQQTRGIAATTIPITIEKIRANVRMIAKGQHDNGDNNTEENNTG